MRILFAFIARQWRLVTPLFATALTAVVIAGMALAPASAHASHDRPLSFSGFANGVRGQIQTELQNGLGTQFDPVSSAKWTNCATGNVQKHGNSKLGPIFGTNIEDDVFLQDPSSVDKFLTADGCGASVTSKVKGDGVGSVDAHAALTTSDQEGRHDRINLDDEVAPDASNDTVTFFDPGLESEAKAFCTTEGHAQVSAGIMGNDFEGESDIQVTGGETPGNNEILGIENQPVDGLEGSGFSATINEVTSSVSGSHGSITVIAFHLVGNGVDLRLAESHANISCPK
jgi:hypothetical protein